jgi:hypothetical protein
MEGDFPYKERKLVEAWIEIHKDDVFYERFNRLGYPSL